MIYKICSLEVSKLTPNKEKIISRLLGKSESVGMEWPVTWSPSLILLSVKSVCVLLVLQLSFS